MYKSEVGKRLLTVLTTFILICTVGAASGLAADKKPIAMKLIHGDQPDPLVAGKQAISVIFKNLVENATNKEVVVEIYPAGVMGKERESTELVKKGIVQAHIASTAGVSPFFPLIAVLDVPFVFSSHAVAYDVFDGWFGEELMAAVAKAIGGVKVIGGIGEAGGFYALTNKVRPIHSPADMKGLKFRVMELPAQIKFIEALGAKATPVAWAEIYTALQTGVVDGQQNPVPIIKHGRIYEVQKYVTLTNHLYGTYWFIVNQKWLESLPSHYQKVILEAARTAVVGGRGMLRIMEATQSGTEFLEKQGMEIYTPTPEELKQFKDLSQPAVISYITSQYGNEGKMWVDKLLKAAEESEKRISQQ